MAFTRVLILTCDFCNENEREVDNADAKNDEEIIASFIATNDEGWTEDEDGYTCPSCNILTQK